MVITLHVETFGRYETCGQDQGRPLRRSTGDIDGDDADMLQHMRFDISSVYLYRVLER